MSSLQLEITTLRDLLASQTGACPKCSSESATQSFATGLLSEKASYMLKSEISSTVTDGRNSESIKEQIKK